MLHRRFFLGLALGIFLCAPAALAEKMIYFSLDIEGEGTILKSRITKSALLKISEIENAHFVILDKEQGEKFGNKQGELYYLRLVIRKGDGLELSFVLFDENKKRVVRKVEKKGVQESRLLEMADIGLGLVLKPLREVKVRAKKNQ